MTNTFQLFRRGLRRFGFNVRRVDSSRSSNDLADAFMKRSVRRSLRWFGLDIHRVGSSRSSDLADFLASRQVDVVLDVGANHGQFGQGLRDRGYRGKIVSFEPVESVFQELKAVAERDSNWQAHHLALGAAAGRTWINVSHKSEFSSILDQAPEAQRLHAAAAVARQEEITVARLDDLFTPFRNHTVFLKIDTQGYERPILEGAREALSRVVGVQLELPLVHLYKGTWSLTDALLYMDATGFVLAQLTSVNCLSEDPVSTVEIDGVFRRRRADE
jgi:FkbM family methyltransferase